MACPERREAWSFHCCSKIDEEFLRVSTGDTGGEATASAVFVREYAVAMIGFAAHALDSAATTGPGPATRREIDASLFQRLQGRLAGADFDALAGSHQHEVEGMIDIRCQRRREAFKADPLRGPSQPCSLAAHGVDQPLRSAGVNDAVRIRLRKDCGDVESPIGSDVQLHAVLQQAPEFADIGGVCF